MKKFFFFLFAFSVVIPALFPEIICAQNYNMTNNVTINTCGGTFYDDAGPLNNYFENQTKTETFCSCNSSPIRFVFTSFATEPIYDYLTIHDGATIASPLIGSYNATTSPGTVTSTNTNYCLTFVFYSDLNTTDIGWSANISCLPGPTATVTASGPTTFCQGGNVTLTANSGSSYSWSTGAVTQSINVTASGNYYVSVINATGCAATSNPVNVTVSATPTVTATGSATICTGGSQQLNASGASSYSWSPAATLSNPAISNPVASPSATTTYSVTGTGSNGCANTATVTVFVDPCTGILSLSQNMNVIISPNPTTGKFQVFQRDIFGAGLKFKIQSLEIYNIMGEQIQNLATGNMQLENNNMTFIDISSHPPGIYFVKVIPVTAGTENEYSFHKIIKQ